MPDGGFSFDALLDALAERVAAKVRADIAQAGNGAVIRPRLFSLKQAAVYLGRTEEAVAHMVSSGKLQAVRGDRRILLDVKDLDRWIDTNKQQELDNTSQ